MITQSVQAPNLDIVPRSALIQVMTRTKSAPRNLPVRSHRETLVNEIFERSTTQIGSDDEMEFLRLFNSLERLTEIEKDEVQLPARTQRDMDRFMDWCQENDVTDVSKVKPVVTIDGLIHEFGLESRVDIAQGDLILEIPRQVMLTNEIHNKDLPFENFAKTDVMVKTMGNVRLALSLIHEFCKRDSFWRPYFKILPTKYQTPLFMTYDQILSLKPSPAFSEAVNLIKSVARQYSYFYNQMIISGSVPSFLSFKKFFTFKLYRWAVGTTMTRQNVIPAKDGNGSNVNALIPLWDLCNHSNGQFSTDFNPKTNSALCYAMKPFSVGSEVTIFYGKRSNGEFLIHNGFVFPDNDFDTLDIKLGISKSDPLYQSKSALCTKCGLSSELSNYKLHHKSQGMDSQMLTFLRIFHLTKEQLEQILAADDPNSKLMEIKDEQLDQKIEQFISTRAALLDRSYEATSGNRPPGSLAAQLIESERKILKSHF